MYSRVSSGIPTGQRHDAVTVVDVTELTVVVVVRVSELKLFSSKLSLTAKDRIPGGLTFSTPGITVTEY